MPHLSQPFNLQVPGLPRSIAGLSGNNPVYRDPDTGRQITKQDFIATKGYTPTEVDLVSAPKYQKQNAQTGRGELTLQYVQPNLFVGQSGGKPSVVLPSMASGGTSVMNPPVPTRPTCSPCPPIFTCDNSPITIVSGPGDVVTTASDSASQDFAPSISDIVMKSFRGTAPTAAVNARVVAAAPPTYPADPMVSEKGYAYPAQIVETNTGYSSPKADATVSSQFQTPPASSGLAAMPSADQQMAASVVTATPVAPVAPVTTSVVPVPGGLLDLITPKTQADWFRIGMGFLAALILIKVFEKH